MYSAQLWLRRALGSANCSPESGLAAARGGLPEGHKAARGQRPLALTADTASRVCTLVQLSRLCL